MRLTKKCSALALAVLFAATGSRSLANIVYDAPNGITNQPSDDPRWNSTVQWNVATGTIIAPNYFLTAQHFDGNVGIDSVSLTTNIGGMTTTTSYQTVNEWNIPGSDLRVISINGTFPACSIVPLYSGGAGNEVGQGVSMLGYGPDMQGNPITTTIGMTTIQNGWTYGGTYAPTPLKNYGEGSVDAIVGGGPNGENMLEYTFGPAHNLSIYGPGDSGGGMFINNGGTWELAGATYGVTQFYTLSGSNYVPVNGAIYDPTGLYVNDGTDMMPDYELATVAQQGYASEIAPFEGQIDQIIGTPEPGSVGVFSIGAMMLLRRSRRGRA